MLTPQERRLQILLRILAAVFGLAVFAYLLALLIWFQTTAERARYRLEYFDPLLSFRPPFSHQSATDRTGFITRRFYHNVQRRLVPSFWRDLVQGVIRMAKQLSYLGYDNDSRTFTSVGYKPFTQREDFAARLLAAPLRERLPLEGDVILVGPGAAGARAVMPHTFANHDFKSVEELRRLPEVNTDASVFPTSVKVNPQLTVMALARYAAPMIAEHGALARTATM